MWPLTNTSTLTATALHSVFSFQAAAQALQNRECVRVTISFMLDLPFLKVMNTDTKKLHLFLLIRNYFSHAMIIQMVNICQLGVIYFLLSEFQNCEKAIKYIGI